MQRRHSSVAEMQSLFLVLISPDFSVCHYSCLFMPLLSPLFSSLSVHLSLPLPPLTLCLSVLPLTSSTFCSTLPSSLSHLLILYSSTSPSNLLASSSAEFPFPVLSYGLSFSPFSSAVHHFINAVKA